MAKDVSKVVLLVPFSSKDASRVIIWRHVKNWLDQTLDYPLYIGEHIPADPSVFNLSLARNHAAQLAGDDWDVAVINDADTIISPQQIRAGVAVALETGAVTYPYTERWELDYEGTKMLLEDEQSDWQSHLRQHTQNQPLGGCIIIRRDLWELVRGFDSGFVGWGHEDGAFAIACQVLSGKKLQRVPGKSLHLEHVAAPAKRADNPIYLANQRRVKQYMLAERKPNAGSLILGLRDESIKTDKDSGIDWPSEDSRMASKSKSALRMLLVDTATVLEKYRCTYWLSDGTLLGAIRENDFIANDDDDVDLGVWAADFDIRVIHELITRYGCGLLRLQGKPEDGMVISIGRVGMHLDMFFYYPLKDKSYSLNNKQAKIYSCLYALHKPYNTSNKAQRYNCVCPDYKPLIRRNFLGHSFWVPKNAKRHLTTIYGSNWEKPVANWDLFNDQKNLSPHSIIKDMNADKLRVAEYLQIDLHDPQEN